MPSTSSLSPDNILRFLQLRSEPASIKELAKSLDLKKSNSQPLFKMLAKLKKRRAIEEMPGGRYRLTKRKTDREDHQQQSARPATPSHRPQPGLASRDEIPGRLTLHPDGYGFMVPDTPVPQLDGDVYIGRDAIENAMHNDHVLVKIQHHSGVTGPQRAEGRIMRILDRAHPTLVNL